ncbi:RecB family exonuclease [Halonotius roseus]|uniref:PD-(D/E)XK nuclease family protein n=1 Tax=Halonotius roseus TaxID=2511997 RepID=A0A544QR35_9EURY|nr:PD-(D/E)XK nuclease family protein [Halonotius roseus]TQQ81900.1 PD-(D/E)XK nuclease family protein [Halonotius roseus]
MPAQTDRVQRLRSEAEPGTIPYVSKSRVSKFITCPEKFYFSYIKGLKGPETGPMRRGTNIHETIEEYYHNVTEYVTEEGDFPDDLVQFLPTVDRWADYLTPYIANFLAFERRRMETVDNPEVWLPVAIEAEEWLEDPYGYGETAIPMMGYADSIYPAVGFPDVDTDDGVVIVDFKTGKTPDKKYRNDGIYLEGEYYALLFESEWDVAAVAGYYPKNDDLIVSPLKESRRTKIESVVRGFQAMNEEAPDHLETDEQPLCYYGEGDGEHCPYYNMCGSTWGEPLKHADRTRALHELGYSKAEIADDLNCDYGAVNYAFYKLDL